MSVPTPTLPEAGADGAADRRDGVHHRLRAGARGR